MTNRNPRPNDTVPTHTHYAVRWHKPYGETRGKEEETFGVGDSYNHPCKDLEEARARAQLYAMGKAIELRDRTSFYGEVDTLKVETFETRESTHKGSTVVQGFNPVMSDPGDAVGADD